LLARNRDRSGEQPERKAGSPDAVMQAGHMTKNSLGEMFAHSSDAVFSINATGRIRFSNRQFERLMGYSADTVRGTWCAEVLCGTDIYGKTFCGTNCPIPKAAPESSANNDFDLVVKRANGDSILVNIGATYIPRQLHEHAGDAAVFFSMRQVNPQRLLQRMVAAPNEGTSQVSGRQREQLTPREKEVLRQAANGMKTTQIARQLSISIQTVRTHFKNIYAKLGVNSRVEAVLFIMQHGLQ
jgi:DNA-binding CsgD family transcriptional regulator